MINACRGSVRPLFLQLEDQKFQNPARISKRGVCATIKNAAEKDTAS